MKKLTKDIRNDVKKLIEKVGGTDNISNYDRNKLFDKYVSEDEQKRWTDFACEVSTTITNQIDYFKYSKGL